MIFISYLVILANLLISGVRFTMIAPDQLNATEGERQELCVTIQENGAPRDRSVGITFGLHPMGKCMTVVYS